MLQQTRLKLMCTSLFLLLIVGMVGMASAATTNQPLIWLDFEQGLQNTGVWGGTATLIDYARNEGPIVSPGVGLGGSAGLDFTRSSRSGGLETEPAGGILSLQHPGQDYPAQFTIALWFYATEPRGWDRLFDPVADPRLDLYIHKSEKLKLEARLGSEPRPRGVTELFAGQWYFAAAAVDLDRWRATFYLGGAHEGHFDMEMDYYMDGPLKMGNEFRLGNADRIRPFKGYMDLVQVWPGYFSEDEVKELWRQGLEILHGGSQ